ncbi:hypothetical protein HY213_04505 [Candidatus Peregrinibacteria bacterium]|nr:hypothetical protein [Candidatus Peregrinibacteria bacterium]
MIFSRKNAGKWVASKKGRVIDASKKLETLLRRVEQRKDRQNIWFDKVPPAPFVGTSYGI